jgi:hypothetical protein
METIKNTVSHLMGSNKEDSSEQHSQHHLPGHHKPHDDQTASTTATSEDQNSSPADTPSKPTSAGNSGSNDQQGHSSEGGDRVQSPDQGPDPALVGDANPKEKLTGTGEPGSHSALFGLTPDGKKNTEASKGSGAPKAAHSKDTAVGGGKQGEETGSRAPSGNKEVSEQMQKAEADPGQKGAQKTDPAPLPAAGDTKPGAGATGLEQGSGKV